MNAPNCAPCSSPCDPCAPARPRPVETLAPARYRIVARSGAINAVSGASVTVEFPTAGRVYAVRGAPTALGGHASLDVATMNIRVGWSKDGADPAVRTNNGVTGGDASLLSLFGRDGGTRDPLSEQGGEDGLCVAGNSKIQVSFTDANGGGTSQAEVVFYFEPATNKG